MDGLFCTPIYRSVIPDSLYGFFTSSEKQFFKDLKRKVKKNVGNVNTIDTYVLENKKLLFLKQKVMEHVNVYFDQVYAPKTDVIPYITQSWINYTDENQFHHKHSHPNSLVSGVLYLDADIDLDSIIFYRPKQYQTITIDTKDDCYNVFNSSLWTYSVKTRDIILFPSSLEHSVETKKGKNTRMSLAFNVFVKGNIGSTQGLSELKL
tara:strand:- start:389 stop:1009 length:621 start_codon:yes stop_codon:yes gene_type:complete